MRIIRAPTEEIARLGLDILRMSIHEILEKKKKVIIAIPGGRSVTGLFINLKEDEMIDWKHVYFFMVDERMVPLTGTESNMKRAKDSFLDHLIKKKRLPEKNVHPLTIDGDVDDKTIKRYDSELKKLGGKFDIVILGAGEDGHIAGLFPNNKALEAKQKRYIALHDAPKPPKDRVTASPALISSADVAILLFIGDMKTLALKRFENPKIKRVDCPAKLVLEAKENYVLTDLKE